MLSRAGSEFGSRPSVTSRATPLRLGQRVLDIAVLITGDAHRPVADERALTAVAQRTGDRLWTVTTASLLVDGGQRWLISSKDPALIAHDRRLRALCEAVGDNYLAVLPGAEAKFRAALLKLRYLVPAK